MTVEEIQNELRRIGQMIGAKHNQYPTVCQLQGGGRPNITISDDGIFSYEAYERGLQVFCYNFTDLDQLMYHSFKNIIPAMASSYASEMESKGHDFRKHFFSKEIELMHTIKPEWGKLIKEELKEELS
jgi:hypothetical protein